MGVVSASVGLLMEAQVEVPMKSAHPVIFYSVAFSYYTAAAYVLFAVVPSVVLKVVGGDLSDDKKRT